MAVIALPGSILTLGAFVLLLLCTLSTPIIKNLYFLKIYVVDNSNLVDTAGALKLGTLGYCSDGLTVTGLQNLTTSVNGAGCTATHLGYDLSSALFTSVSEVAGVDLTGIDNSVIKGLTYALVLVPIAAGFAGASCFLAALAFCCSSRISEILAFMLTILSAIVAWLAWAFVMALFSIAKSRVHRASNGYLQGILGNCIWMSLAAAIALTVSLVFLCCGMFGPYSHHRRDRRGDVQQSDMAYANAQNGNTATMGYAPVQKGGKFAFWRRQPRGTSTY